MDRAIMIALILLALASVLYMLFYLLIPVFVVVAMIMLFRNLDKI